MVAGGGFHWWSLVEDGEPPPAGSNGSSHGFENALRAPRFTSCSDVRSRHMTLWVVRRNHVITVMTSQHIALPVDVLQHQDDCVMNIYAPLRLINAWLTLVPRHSFMGIYSKKFILGNMV